MPLRAYHSLILPDGTTQSLSVVRFDDAGTIQGVLQTRYYLGDVDDCREERSICEQTSLLCLR